MDFFEKELRKIVSPQHPDAVYAGRACYVRLDDLARAKIQFVTCGVSAEYPALGVTILNRHKGKVDEVKLRFGEILSAKRAHDIFVWENCGPVQWCGFQPSQEDYLKISGVLERYLSVFQEQGQTNTQQWKPVMQ